MPNKTYRRFGRELKISPKSIVEITEDAAVVTVKIGQYEAYLTMTPGAFEAFASGEDVKIETAKELKSQLYKY